jgi:hypothetical protein
MLNERTIRHTSVVISPPFENGQDKHRNCNNDFFDLFHRDLQKRKSPASAGLKWLRRYFPEAQFLAEQPGAEAIEAIREHGRCQEEDEQDGANRFP